MDSGSPCQRHDEQIKALNKKVEDMENIKTIMYNLDKNMAVQTTMLQHIVDHNIKQDMRMDKQELRADKQDEVMGQVSINLAELNEELKGVKNEVNTVKKVQLGNEEKHSIDLRDIEKERYVDLVLKYSLPIGGGIVIIWQIIQAIK